MTALRKMDRDRLLAEAASIARMLEALSDEDAVMRMGLEDRLEELREGVAEAEGARLEHTASAALFFGGAPVVGSRGIESEFGAKAVGVFQDLVAKQFAFETGGLGQRGIVPNKAATRLHITNVVRGSFGFMLEEIDNQTGLVDSPLKDSVDHVADLIGAFGDDDEERFQTAIEDIDERVLGTTREFFALMRLNGATFRIVNGERDRAFSLPLIERAERRATTTTVTDSEEAIRGVYVAALPEAHQLEFRTDSDRGTIRARIDRAVPSAQIQDLNRTWMEQPALGRFAVRRVVKEGTVVRENFKLISVDALED
jgi:hypothetical protein